MNKDMKYGEGPRRIRCPWAPNVLATPLLLTGSIDLVTRFKWSQFAALQTNKQITCHFVAVDDGDDDDDDGGNDDRDDSCDSIRGSSR